LDWREGAVGANISVRLGGMMATIQDALRKLKTLDQEGRLACPVDFEAMCACGRVDLPSVGAKTKIDRQKCTVVTGSVEVEKLALDAPMLVQGNLIVKVLTTTSDLVVLGNAEVLNSVVGTGGVNSDHPGLTVVGKVTIGHAEMRGGYIMQFLGGGTVREFGDEDGGVEELLDLLGKKLKVSKIVPLS